MCERVFSPISILISVDQFFSHINFLFKEKLNFTEKLFKNEKNIDEKLHSLKLRSCRFLTDFGVSRYIWLN